MFGLQIFKDPSKEESAASLDEAVEGFDVSLASLVVVVLLVFEVSMNGVEAAVVLTKGAVFPKENL